MSKHSVPASDVSALLCRFAEIRRKAAARTGRDFPIIVIQEAGLDGFWIHRVLQSEGIESHVVDAASILTSRRRRRAKTDRIDGETLVRTLMAFKRGEPRVCSMARAPTPQGEDRRRVCRERRTQYGNARSPGDACRICLSVVRDASDQHRELPLRSILTDDRAAPNPLRPIGDCEYRTRGIPADCHPRVATSKTAFRPNAVEGVFRRGEFSQTIWPVIAPLALVAVAIRPGKDAVAGELAVPKLALVAPSIGPAIDAMAVECAVVELALVMFIRTVPKPPRINKSAVWGEAVLTRSGSRAQLPLAGRPNAVLQPIPC